jgi:hypothetical protein
VTTITLSNPRQQARDLPPNVYRHRGRSGCFAQFKRGKRSIYVGYFRTVEDASRAVALARADREAAKAGERRR